MKVVTESIWESNSAEGIDTEEGLLPDVQSVYGLGRCSVVRRVVTWGSNRRLQLCDSDGTNYFLKEKPYYLASDEFDFHLRLQNYIWQQNGPVVAIIPTLNGCRSFCWKDRTFELQEWFEGGRELDFRQPDYHRELGSLISRFLIAAAGFKDVQEGDWRFPQSRSEVVPETSGEVEKYARHIDEKLIRLGRQNVRAMFELRAKIKGYGASLESTEIPQQFIHGDPCGSNCLSSNSLRGNNGTSVLIDLDCAHWGYRLSDVGMALAVLAGMKPQEGSPKYITREKWDLNGIGAFLDGFNNESPLLSLEVGHLKSFLGLNMVRACVSCLQLDDPEVAPPPDLPDQLAMLIDLLESLDHLTICGAGSV